MTYKLTQNNVDDIKIRLGYGTTVMVSDVEINQLIEAWEDQANVVVLRGLLSEANSRIEMLEKANG